MDFSKLTDNELDDFLGVYHREIPLDRSQKINLASQIYEEYGREGQYTPSVADLYSATYLISQDNHQKYDHSLLLTASVKKLSPLFKHFGLQPTEKNRPRLIHILDLGNAILYPIGYLVTLPEELLREILLKLSDKELRRTCRTSKKLENICDSGEFWHDRYDLNFGEPIPQHLKDLSWKEIYEQYMLSRLITIINIATKIVTTKRFFIDDTISQLFAYLHTLTDQQLIACKFSFDTLQYDNLTIEETLFNGQNLQFVKYDFVDYTWHSEDFVYAWETLPHFRHIAVMKFGFQGIKMGMRERENPPVLPQILNH